MKQREKKQERNINTADLGPDLQNISAGTD